MSCAAAQAGIDCKRAGARAAVKHEFNPLRQP